MSVVVRSTAGVRASAPFTNLILPLAQDQLGVSGTAYPGLVVVVRDTVGVDSDAMYRSFTTVTDRAGVRSEAVPVAHITRRVLDRAGITSRSAGLEATMLGAEDTLGASGRVAATGQRYVVRDTAGVTTAVGAVSTSTVAVRDMLGVSGRYRVRGMAVARATAGITSRVHTPTPHQHVVRVRAGITARTMTGLGAKARGRGVVGVTSRVTPVGDIRVVVHDRAFIHGRAIPRPQWKPGTDVLDATSAWTADMRSWGMSRYTGLPVDDFIGAQFGVGPGGVYTADKLADVSWVETGMTTLSVATEGQPRPVMERKRINYVYTYSAHDKPLKIRVTADFQGARMSMDYTQESRSSDTTRAVRCAVGRGFATNYVQLRVGGPPFDLAQCEVEITPTRRRI